MARLVFASITSLDLYVADEDGRVRVGGSPTRRCTGTSTTSSDRSAHTCFGRRMYEVHGAWETMEVEGEPP